jgi:hypothetical protein
MIYYMLVLLVGDCVKHRPRCITRRDMGLEMNAAEIKGS